MKIIKDRCINVSHLGRKLGVKQQTLQSWLSGARKMPEWAKDMLREELGV